MRLILRQIAVTSFFITFPFLLILGLSFLYYPPVSSERIIDTGNNRSSIFRSPMSQIILGANRFKITSKPKLIFFGSSNVREGFRPSDSSKLFPEFESHNLAVGASNITQIKQIISHAGNYLSKETAEQSIFVLGVWYGNFVTNGDRFWTGVTDFENELMRTEVFRSVLFSLNKTDLPPILKNINHNIRISLIRPFLLLGDFRLQLKSNFIPFLRQKTKKITHWRNSYFWNQRSLKKPQVIKNRDIEGAMKFMNGYMHSDDGSIKDDQFLELINVGHVVSSLGSRLILVDLPIPNWHSSHSEHFKYYQKEKIKYFKKMSLNQNFQYIDLQYTLTDSDFKDMAHPKHESTLKIMEHFKTKGRILPLNSN